MEEITDVNAMEGQINKIVIEEVDPEELNKIWDTLPEIKAAF
jgi:hypothetical protein